MQRLENMAQWKLDSNLRSFDSSRHIPISSLNTQSLFLHFDKILSDFDLMHSNIICLQETRDTKRTNFALFNKTFHCFSTNGCHDTITFADRKFAIKKYDTHIRDHMEAIVLSLYYHGTYLLVTNIYKAPHGLLSELFSCIGSIFISCTGSTKIILTGDFNVDMLEKSEAQKNCLNSCSTMVCH